MMFFTPAVIAAVLAIACPFSAKHHYPPKHHRHHHCCWAHA
jgi:hypothetical protein